MYIDEFGVLQAVSKVSGKNDKRKLLKQNSANRRLADLLNACFNYKRKYFIKKWDTNLPTVVPSKAKDLHQDFMNLLNDLESQVYRGDVAKTMVESFLSNCSVQQQEWYSKVLLRDLKAGFGVDSAIDCGFNIPLFEVQLAKDGYECKRLPALLKEGLSVSRKLDGYRCLAIVDSSDESVTLYTRNGEEFLNFPSIQQSLAKLCINKKHNAKYVFDGEIMSDDFNKTQKSAFASKRGTTVGDVKYHIFDMIPYNEWANDKFTTPAFERYQTLDLWFGVAQAQMQAHDITNLVQVERTMVHNMQDILRLEQQYIAEGYEGAMANPNLPYYKGKKSNAMLKFKTFVSMDCEVVDTFPGKPGTKYENMLGGFIVRQENDVLCDVGSGYDDAERQELWDKQKELIGRVMEVKYQNLSDEDKRMRFPIFVRWRDLGAGRGKI
jgi:ATP-dependent DNA ligase